MTGRSPSGRAGRPADQAPAGLGDAATIPNAGISDCGPDGGCEECDICRYLNFIDWASAVAPSGSTIERNPKIEDYLRRTYPQSAQGIEARQGQDRETGLGATHESPVAESDAPKGQRA